VICYRVLEVEEGQDEYVTNTIYDRETKLPVFQCAHLNGVLESPPDGSPSEIQFDEQGQPEHMKWHHQGSLYRRGAPASIFRDNDTGIHLIERFMGHGEIPDHTKVLRDKLTGKITGQYLKGETLPKVSEGKKKPAPGPKL